MTKSVVSCGTPQSLTYEIFTSTCFSFHPHLSNLNKQTPQLRSLCTSIRYSGPNPSHALNPLTITTAMDILLTSNLLTRDLISAFSPDHIITGPYQQLMPTSKPFGLNFKFTYIKARSATPIFY